MEKRVLVTGASRGIGRAIAIKFLQEGYIVYGTFFESEKRMDSLIKQYGSEKCKKMGPYDFRKIEHVEKLVQDVSGITFDTLVLNAGTFSDNDDFLNFDLNVFNEVMNCNFYSQLIIATRLREYVRNGGNIVLMSSNDAYSGAYGSMSYSISKSAVISLMKCLSVNYGRKQIRVNSIAPGAINTDMNTPEQEFESPLWTPIQRIAEPYEVANVVYFLSTPESSFINGENITIDGGYGNVSVLLKSEIERARKIEGYTWLNEKMKSLKVGDKVYCFDATPTYGWVHNEKEEEYLKNHIQAIERGVEVYRFIMTSKERKDAILQNDLVRETLEKSSQAKFIGVILEEEIKKYNRNVFSKIGSGFEIFLYQDGTSEVFIDSYTDEESVGYVSDSELMIHSLLEVFEDVYTNVLNEKIKVYK